LTPLDDAIRRGRSALIELAGRAGRSPLALECIPPPPAKPTPYGDVVPLGLVLRALALDRSDASSTAAAGLRLLLGRRRRGLLWPYHSGGLATATDSGLVLLGWSDRSAIEELEAFADGDIGYVPQLCASDRIAGHMPVSPFNRHWCQTDYGTTCLVLALRREAGLVPSAGLNRLIGGFEKRSGLYFANPYLIDWLLAVALGPERATEPLRAQLAAEILASARDDGSFGTFDPSLSTAFALLALDALGVGGRQVEAARTFLARTIEDDGRWPAATPFYSSVILPAGHFDAATWMGLAFGERRAQIAMIGPEIHAITLYRDDVRLITTAAAVLALHRPARPARSKPLPAADMHRRYQAAGPVEYAVESGLPPYVGGGWRGRFADA
jgi:hypothetical protein